MARTRDASARSGVREAYLQQSSSWDRLVRNSFAMDLSTLYLYQQTSRATRISPNTLTRRVVGTDRMSQHTAFFYGTLMAPQVLYRVIWGSQTPPTPAHASLLHIRPAILPSHRRHRVRHADYPAILPSSDPDACVRGTLVTGLTDGDIWRLDIFEGSEYSRQKVQVKILRKTSDDGGENNKEEEQEAECETYIWTAAPSRLETSEWDFDEFVRDKMKRWVGIEGAEADEGFQGRPSINGNRGVPKVPISFHCSLSLSFHLAQKKHPRADLCLFRC